MPLHYCSSSSSHTRTGQATMPLLEEAFGMRPTYIQRLWMSLMYMFMIALASFIIAIIGGETYRKSNQAMQIKSPLVGTLLLLTFTTTSTGPPPPPWWMSKPTSLSIPTTTFVLYIHHTASLYINAVHWCSSTDYLCTHWCHGHVHFYLKLDKGR